MLHKLFDVSTCNAVDIQCTGIAYRYVTDMGSPSLRKEDSPLTFFISICPYVCFGEAHSGSISLNLVFETFIKSCWGNTYFIKIGQNFT